MLVMINFSLTTFKAEFCSAAVMFFNNLEEAQQ